MSGAARGSGRLVAIEGIDGSGKGTQSRLLAEALRRDHTVAELTFPQYEQTRFGKQIRRMLAGEFGPLDHLPPELTALLFAGDRFESADRLADLLSDHEVVVCDRYVASNAAHQAGRLTEPRRAQLLDFLDWLEHDRYQLPRADATVLLDLPSEVAIENIRRRSATTGRAIDLAERDAAHLEQTASVYRETAATQGWLVVRCDDDGTMLGRAQIAAQIEAAVRSTLG